MKILQCSNFDDEMYSEKIVAEGIKNRRMADIMCRALVEAVSERGPDYFRVVEDDYKPRSFEP